MTDRDIIMAERPPEEPSAPHWVVEFSDMSSFEIPDSVPEYEVVTEGERQHTQLGLEGVFGFAFHVPSGKFIHGPISRGELHYFGFR